MLGRRSARARRVRGDTEYFAGLDHLVNDRYDRAAEVFTRLATKSHEAEIQFALGSLMRKRGEVDRAIAIHTGLAENRDPAIREQATLALGLDYMSAGLMDRAEEKLRSLLGSERYRAGGAGKAGVGLRAATRLARGAGPVARTAARKAGRTGRGCRALLLRTRAKRRWPPAISPPRAPSWPRRGYTLPMARAPACWRRASRRLRARNRRALELYTAALAGSRTMEEAFLQEAHAALGRARRGARHAAAGAAPRRTGRAAAGRAFPLSAMRSRQCHLALALPPLPHVGLAAQSQ